MPQQRTQRTNKESPGGSPKGDRTKSRAHRDDTPEAKRQREAIPKTHPTRAPSAARKDKR